jgi:hypothetical protein
MELSGEAALLLSTTFQLTQTRLWKHLPHIYSKYRVISHIYYSQLRFLFTKVKMVGQHWDDRRNFLLLLSVIKADDIKLSNPQATLEAFGDSTTLRGLKDQFNKLKRDADMILAAHQDGSEVSTPVKKAAVKPKKRVKKETEGGSVKKQKMVMASEDSVDEGYLSE